MWTQLIWPGPLLRAPGAGATRRLVSPAEVLLIRAAPPALLDRLRGLRPSQLLAVVDLAESVDGAALGDDAEGRERVRQRCGISG
jgi:hypothetical protein